MIVLDTSAAIDWMLQTPTGQRIAHRIFSRGEPVHTVHLLDLEFVQVMRRMVFQRTLTASRAEEAIEGRAGRAPCGEGGSALDRGRPGVGQGGHGLQEAAAGVSSPDGA